MILSAAPTRRAFAFDRPAIQWDAPRGAGPLTVRLFGRLGARELGQVAEAIAERGRSPRDLVLVDFERVDHLDYRALPDFVRAVLAQMNRGAEVRFAGMTRYLRDLFDVSGQGPILSRLEWTPEGQVVAMRRPPLGLDTRVANPGPGRRDFWQ